MANAANDKQLASFGDMTGKTKYNGVNFLAGSGVTMIKAIGVTEYANLATKDPSVLYLVVPDGTVPVIPDETNKMEYLTFEIVSAGTIASHADGGATRTFYYSKNNGPWTEFTSTSGYASFVSGDVGDKIRVKGNTVFSPSSNIYTAFRNGTAKYNLSGNIMSLDYGDNFSAVTTIQAREFNNLFTSGQQIVSAKDLYLPPSTAPYCYAGMFYYATSMTEPPALPSTSVTEYCYGDMFMGCSGMQTAPLLPATTLAYRSYYGMFSGCSNLNSVTCYAMDRSAEECIMYWLNNVASSGDFYKKDTSWTATGGNNIPSGWTQHNI